MSMHSERPQKDLGCLLYHIYIIYMSLVIFLGAGFLTRLVVKKCRHPPVSATHSTVLYVLHDSKLVCSYYPAQRVLWRTKHGFCLSTLWDPESSSGHQVWQQVPSPAEPSRWLSSHLLYVLDKVSFCSPGCPGIHYVAQAGLRFTATFLSRPPNSGIPSLCHLPQ